MREELAKTVENARAPGGGGGGLLDLGAFTVLDGEGGDGYAEFKQEQQLHTKREQNQHLYSVFQTAGNLRR